ncbi:hypothetical protein EYR40_003147 [Pleurotus pulmonarius]|nr:hypothetical protein EYR40_003147 [Pleurotus pulmonarius]
MSLTPTRNAFSKLRAHGFNIYEILVPDLLHEFELGVWKAVFTHLVRILHSIGQESILKLNQRYRSVPTFGRSVIRQFHEDAASMKKLAARDFEDLLLCAIPVFEGLFSPSDGKIILDLLFTLSTWHGLAKLRIHTDDTIRLLSNATKSLGVINYFDGGKDDERVIELLAWFQREVFSGRAPAATNEENIPDSEDEAENEGEDARIAKQRELRRNQRNANNGNST